MINTKHVNILGVEINNFSMDEVLSKIDTLIQGDKISLVCTVNANHIRLIRSDQEFARIYSKAALITADGMSIIWASKFLGCPLKEKVSGSDLVVEICKNSFLKGYKLYFLGAAEGVAEKAKIRCEKRYPGVKIVGCYSPKREEIMNKEQSRKIILKINSTDANILLVAFGPPLQEKWIQRHSSELNTQVAIGIGGAIDYLAGVVKRPPLFLRRLGLEWFGRLSQDPRRYFKRYLIDFSIFYYVILEKLKIIKH